MKLLFLISILSLSLTIKLRLASKDSLSTNSTDQLTNHLSTNKLTDQLTNKLTDQLTNKLTDQLTNKLTDQLTDHLSTNSTEQDSTNHVPTRKINKQDNSLIRFLLDPRQKQIQESIIGKDKDLNKMKEGLNGDGYKVMNIFPRTHFKGQEFFVQGFKFDKDSNQIIESAGLYGESEIHRLDLNKMEISSQQRLSKQYFGEGNDWIMLNGEKEYHQLTYKERKVFVYNQNLKLKNSYEIPSEIKEGWGLKHLVLNNKYYLLVTDGTERVFVVDPDGWTIKGIYEVMDNGSYQPMLNEIEVIGRYLYANVYLSNEIVKIDIGSLIDNGVGDPASTFPIVRRYDFTPIVNMIKQTDYYKQNNLNYGHCLNGIAYNQNDRLVYLTGKKWPAIFQVKLIDQ